MNRGQRKENGICYHCFIFILFFGFVGLKEGPGLDLSNIYEMSVQLGVSFFFCLIHS